MDSFIDLVGSINLWRALSIPTASVSYVITRNALTSICRQLIANITAS